jgi:hypothetical protein
MGLWSFKYVELRPYRDWQLLLFLNPIFGEKARDIDSIYFMDGYRSAGSHFEPVAAGRGLPEDLSPKLAREIEQFQGTIRDPSYLTVDEIHDVDYGSTWEGEDEPWAEHDHFYYWARRYTLERRDDDWNVLETMPLHHLSASEWESIDDLWDEDGVEFEGEWVTLRRVTRREVLGDRWFEFLDALDALRSLCGPDPAAKPKTRLVFWHD